MLNDRSGLKVTGRCTYISGGEHHISGAILGCEFKSECNGGYQQVGNYYAFASGGYGYGIPMGAVEFPVQFNHAQSLNDLVGEVQVVSFTFALGPGVSFGHLCLNNHCVSGGSPVIGIDLSYDVFFEGAGSFSTIWEDECCEEKPPSWPLTHDTF